MQNETPSAAADRWPIRLSLTLLASSFTVAALSAWSPAGLVPVGIAGTCCAVAFWQSGRAHSL